MAEWLALRHGGMRPVVSCPGDDGGTELLSPDAWAARLARDRQRPPCSCGRPCLGSGRTCGSAQCVARLRAELSAR